MSKQSAEEIFGRVARRIEAQSFLPNSPGVLVDNEPVFCTGAAFVYEAAQGRLSSADSEKLASDLLSNGKSGLVQKAIEFDLDVRLVEQTISMNDSFPDDCRKARMHQEALRFAAGRKSR